MKNTRRLVIVAVIGGALLALVLALSRSDGARPGTPAPGAPAVSNTSAPAQSDNPFVAAATNVVSSTTDFDSMSRSEAAFEIILRLLFAVILSGILAFRPRKDVPLFRRSLFVSQTQILLAVVAAALMMVVGDKRGPSLRYICGGVAGTLPDQHSGSKGDHGSAYQSSLLGLAAGVGRWELGVALCLFALALLWLLEFNEKENIYRSMELTVKTTNTDRTQEVLRKIFRRRRLDGEVRELDPPEKEGDTGCIVYYVNLPLTLTTDSLSDLVLKNDPSVEKIQWSKTKSAGDIYQ